MTIPGFNTKKCAKWVPYDEQEEKCGGTAGRGHVQGFANAKNCCVPNCKIVKEYIGIYFFDYWTCHECKPGYHRETFYDQPFCPSPRKDCNDKVLCIKDTPPPTTRPPTPTPTDTPTDAPTDNPCYPHWHLEDGACVCDLGYHLECHQHGRVCTCKENQCSPAQCRH